MSGTRATLQMGFYKIPRRSSPPPLHPTERARIIRDCLGEPDPITNQKQRLAIKIRHLRRAKNEVAAQRDELREMLTTTTDQGDNQALKKEIRELKKMLDNQDSGITRLEGHLRL